MYLSKITLSTARLTPERLMEMMARGEYVMHQWLWELFPGVAQRQYLYRRETLQNGFCFYLLSASAPERTHPLFEIQMRPFAPAPDEGTTLRFSLRANPVVTRNGKRHDVLMNAKREWQLNQKQGALWTMQEQAALAWLDAQGEKSGFRLSQACVAAYRQQQVVKKRGELIQFSTVDYEGALIVTDPARFIARLHEGFGKCRAFGCGLMLIKPGDGV
ncbi:type I-E CRISPR-associated protein Cas6/Cse3/CasE [Cronobacter sakazakii]|uniref:type I-E CRISPR-associated protein Cas6/Cse3/CasE n=1 Tax=Cronobacter sakazakii TaxID=28141 RepID=UPI00084E212B|nr:type I-E CRISPR-associated protein Cas6/Cse3/CasE [Cronobacter sakazakii]EJG0601516.1 type I-E CRISPR-associated protein Cas6/Cse3/CasE [Cronobacter sakazakii]EJG0605056.1 type I-E CRISPR-associated protein Cas6/Cse3/CasE [Cronobacter sakazakii]EJG0612135.1 type I-E CRISPR-associated protein Cas6/Cse3/CasE [Cronobacter sakazakii]EJG0614155.1 type I-E CRISPR-associated protein Cas6/Cse3/CasE [Cronobacter sakazakii]EJG0623315.1 type I-E CRISPR-associated protein Cas6/Cse3/CasE [Cronobacter sa